VSRSSRAAGLAAMVVLTVGALGGCVASSVSDGGAHGPTEPAMTPAPSASHGDGGANGPDQPTLTQPPEGQSPSAAPGLVLGGTTSVYAFSEPSTQAAVVRQFYGGEAVSIVCTAPGEQVTAGGSVSDLWDRISSGGFLPDVQVDTGSNEAVMPECSG
jgi:hypothetical protein